MSNEPRERHSGGPSDYNQTSRAVEQDTMLTRTCVVCYESKPLTGFPTAPQVPSHSHDNEVCNECYASHLDVEITKKIWHKISCPQCPTVLSREVINILASPMTWERYQYLSERATQANNSDYRYCFSTTCNSGQTHDGGLIFSCQSCGHQHCTACNVNWHEGETCEQSKARRQEQRQEEAASAEFIQSSTKACPQCHVKIERVDGCDHMTCKFTYLPNFLCAKVCHFYTSPTKGRVDFSL